jgi:trigger factor
MAIPGLGATMEDPELRERAEREAERLLDTLKKSVQTQTRDIGVLRKELRVTVPGDVIAEHMSHNYSELMHDAHVPGFRKGRAPRRLVEKRFGPEVRESLKTSLLGQSYFAATEKEKLDVLGDPLFCIPQDGGGVKLMDIGEALQHITLPESGDFSYACEIELRPTFTLPELKGIEIKAPRIEVTAQMVEDELLRQRKNRGRYEPTVEAASDDDLVIADVTLFVDSQNVKHEENVQLGVRPTRLDGVPLLELGQALRGAKPGDRRSTDGTLPDDYERADLRGKSGRFEFEIHEVKRLVPLSTADFLKVLGFENEDELRDYYQGEMEDESDRLIVRAKKLQVEEYLLKHAELDLPSDLSARQTDRAVVRKVIELQQRGVPMSEIEAHIDELRTRAKGEATRELKLAFILDKVAAQLEVEVTDEEVNTEIARMARLYHRRFDRVRDDLQSQGLLTQLAEQIRQDKCVQMLLADARVVDAEPDARSAPVVDGT